jgi:hypothetical protein
LHNPHKRGSTIATMSDIWRRGATLQRKRVLLILDSNTLFQVSNLQVSNMRIQVRTPMPGISAGGRLRGAVGK